MADDASTTTDAAQTTVPAATTATTAATAPPQAPPPPPAPSATSTTVGTSDSSHGVSTTSAATVATVAAPASSSEGSKFKVPTRAIYSDADLRNFQTSKTYKDLTTFLKRLNTSVRGVKFSDKHTVNATVSQLEDFLKGATLWVDDIPPIKQPMRFGNKAFRLWHERLTKEVPTMLSALLPASLQDAAAEVGEYLLGSFGHPVRIDYGTGHEMTFILFLMTLFKLGVLQTQDLTAVVVRVYTAYLKVCQTVQQVYWLEPAGSKGAWSLDDYQMVVFLFGSSQLAGSRLKPSCIHDGDLVDHFATEYMYLQAVKFIKSVKKGGSFREIAPILSTVSDLSSWEEVNRGMLKMFFGEVVDKFPVAQHILFGSIIPATWTPSPQPQMPVHRTIHPAVAASLAKQQRGGGGGGAGTGAGMGAAGAMTGVAPWARGPAAAGGGGAPTGVAPWASNPGASAASSHMPTGAAPWARGAAPTGVAPWAAAARGPSIAAPGGAGGAAGASGGDTGMSSFAMGTVQTSGANLKLT